MSGRVSVKIAAMRCATGGRRLAVEGDRDCLLLGSRGPEYCCLAWLVSADHGYSRRTISLNRSDRIVFHIIGRLLGIAWACPCSLVRFPEALDCAGSEF
eukprot:360671-Chlamydomonas_euryale.AAC.4